MAGISDKEYYNYVDEALVLFGGGAPCVNIDPRLWNKFKDEYKEFNDAVPKTVDWSHEQVCEWMDEYLRAQKEQDKNR
jgi:aromatic ring-opening dioxygenase catalytic subunit (LigB family)